MLLHRPRNEVIRFHFVHVEPRNRRFVISCNEQTQVRRSSESSRLKRKPLTSSMCSWRHCPRTNFGGFPLNIVIRAGHFLVLVDIMLQRQSTRLTFSFMTMNRMLSTGRHEIRFIRFWSEHREGGVKKVPTKQQVMGKEELDIYGNSIPCVRLESRNYWQFKTK